MLAQVTGGGWSALDWSPDDKQILILEEISANETYLWLMDSATGEKTLLTSQGWRGKNLLRQREIPAKTQREFISPRTKTSNSSASPTWISLPKNITFPCRAYSLQTSEDFDITPDGEDSLPSPHE